MEQKDQKSGKKYEDGSERAIGALGEAHRRLGPGLPEAAQRSIRLTSASRSDPLNLLIFPIFMLSPLLVLLASGEARDDAQQGGPVPA
jgi:hypothetical protein